MFELIAIGVALALGFGAGLWDLKTTDIPDEAPVLMTILGLFIWYVYALTTGAWMPFITSVCLGTVVFALGWGLYKAGQWGGGDAALLAGIFFLLPNIGFMTSFMLNFLIVALVYSVFYSICIGFSQPKVFEYTVREIKQRKLWILLLVWLIFGAVMMTALALMGVDLNLMMVLWLAVFGMVLFYVYAKVIEHRAFRRFVPISKLKIGDVLVSSARWEGITYEKIRELKRRHVRRVELKEGVRFGLVFPLALLVTLLFGNIMFWIVGIV